MALITCPECGKQISDKAKQCPNCGCPASAIHKESVQLPVCPQCGYIFHNGIPNNCPICKLPSSQIISANEKIKGNHVNDTVSSSNEVGAEEKEQPSDNMLGEIMSFIYDFIPPKVFWSIITILALVVIIFFSLKPSVSSASLSDLKEVIGNKYGEDSELYRRYNKLSSDYWLFPMDHDVLFRQNKGRFAKEYLPLVESFFSFCDSIGAKNASQEILKEKNHWQDAYQDEIGKYGVCKKCGKHCSIDGSYTIPPQNGFPAQEYKDQYNLCGKCAANAPSYAVQKFMREQMGAGAGRKDQEYYAHPSW